MRASRPITKATASALDMTSHTPSHACVAGHTGLQAAPWISEPSGLQSYTRRTVAARRGRQAAGIVAVTTHARARTAGQHA